MITPESIKKTSVKTISGHLGFWVFSFFILLLIFRQPGGIHTIDFIYTLIFFGSLVPMVYLNLLTSISGLLKQKRYFLFGLISILSILIFSIINRLLFDRIADLIFPDYYFVSYFTFVEIIIAHMIFLILATLLSMSRSWFDLLEYQKKVAMLKKDQKEAELNALKGQVNPHFLFNTLNNLYSLARQKSLLTAEMILKLSDLMRYVLHETSDDFVRLKDEIHFIENYVNLQKLRTKNPNVVSFNFPHQTGRMKIAPLILIHFVENCFKHGLKADIENAFVRIDLELKDGILGFQTKNNIGVVDDIEDGSSSGKGLLNARKRLDLIYGENYHLEMKSLDDTFNLYVTIDLKPTANK